MQSYPTSARYGYARGPTCMNMITRGCTHYQPLERTSCIDRPSTCFDWKQHLNSDVMSSFELEI